ncbi:Mth938-like domain-containing protein [Candidatus Woesearchaeota archaeon]|nr:Mth938-like domain-containing protein [Candidatus Woesearchaeota archaeon]
MIDEYKFGSFRIKGKNYLDDVKIIGNKVRGYSLMDHRKGLTLEDMKDIIEAKPKIVIIGSGATGLLIINKDVKDFLRTSGSQVIVEKTSDAVGTFNRLTKENNNVAAFLHATS